MQSLRGYFINLSVVLVVLLFIWVFFRQVSAVTREGMDDLLETLVLQAEVLELRADGEVSISGAETTSLCHGSAPKDPTSTQQLPML